MIGLNWTAGIYNGGASVIDYTLSYDQGYNSYKTLASGIVGTSYTATQLTAGLTFKFKIQARNVIGLSVMSTEVSILCARIPDAPTSLANNSAVSNDVQIGLAWANGMSNGGASIINYQVSYDDGTNRWVTSSVMTQSFIASGLKPGTLYIFKVQSRNPVGLSMASSTI